MKKAPKVLVTILFEKNQIEALDLLVGTGKYANRCHVVRFAVQKLLEEEKETLKKLM